MSAFRLALILSAAALAACSDFTDPGRPVTDLPDEEITIAPNPVSIKVGETIALRATGLGPGIIVLWSSDDPSVADVAVGGFLRGINPGATTVYARAGDRTAAALVTVDGGDGKN